uniref:Uncharacterized protein n=1 Tax=Utricularia reniformis TaxID=192314 RepID=A0A1Y0AZQ6_9LAMI|nr:hypothetical protein AEK19_MT0375 [Utricularia reniformis]ART30647.1 hypothetical protein AEK19_MT0375 [Utricularia reniformis]
MLLFQLLEQGDKAFLLIWMPERLDVIQLRKKSISERLTRFYPFEYTTIVLKDGIFVGHTQFLYNIKFRGRGDIRY